MPYYEELVSYVAEKTAESGYDPANGTNWCHLPLEMRVRTHLRRTSSTEKSLVEMTTHHFQRVTIRDEGDSLSINAINKFDGGWLFVNWFDNIKLCWYHSREEKLAAASSVMKNAKMTAFSFRGHENARGLQNPDLKALEECAPFHFKTFTTDNKFIDANRLFLENCEDLERITFRYFRNGQQQSFYAELFTIPSVINVKDLRISDCDELDALWDLIAKWIEIDADVGKSVQFSAETRKTIPKFSAKFADRIIENSKKLVRIRMNDESKQILLRKVSPARCDLDFMSCKVIPAGLPKSRYRKGDRWIEQMLRVECWMDGNTDEISDTDAFCSDDEW